MEEQNVGVSTPPASAAIAQSRQQAGAGQGEQEARGQELPELEFTIDANVLRAVMTRPYERQASDPLYRPLRIFSLDPSASKLEGSIATVNVPYEPLQPGPIGRFLEVDDYDSSEQRHWGRVDLDDHHVLLNDGRAPSTSDPLFHQQMVYVVAATVCAAFRRALGRHLCWGHGNTAADGKLSSRLKIRPHAFREQNAYYDKRTGELAFGYFKAPPDVQGKTLPGGVVFTCLSHDIVAHEVTHAVLDGLRAHFTEPTNADVLGFHEGFADLVATFQHFSYPEVVQAAIRAQGSLDDRLQLLAGIAHQFGSTLGSTKPLRTAFQDMDKAPKRYRPDMEAHEMGEVLVQALFEAALTVFKRKSAPYFRLATGGTGRLPEGDMPADLQNILGAQASKIASHFLSIAIRALDYCPPVDLELGEYLRALVTADAELVPDDPWAYREAMIDAFRLRGIFPPQVQSLSEESLLWAPPFRPDFIIPDLDFASLKFNGDPASPADVNELRRQAMALGGFLTRREHLDQFGVTWRDDPRLEGDAVELPRIQSIRTARRVGPDGQIVFDLVAEVTQRRHVAAGAGTFPFYGGATVIIGPKGEIRYVIAKSILNARRIRQQQEFIREQGARFWFEREGRMLPQALAFKVLHEPRA